MGCKKGGRKSGKGSGFQEWCEKNNVPNIVTGTNRKTLSLKVYSSGYCWNTPCRRTVREDEGILPS